MKNVMSMRKGMKHGKMKGMSSDCCATMQPKSPPSSPSQKRPATSWPSEGVNVGLGQDKRSGKNRERSSFKGGHQW